MPVIDALHGPVHQPAKGPATAAVVMLHGYGSDGNDLIGLTPFFANVLPHAAFYAPNGPHAVEGSPFGGRQWFSLRNYHPDMRLGPKFYESIADDVANSSAAIGAYLDQILAHHKLAANRLVLLGFSQGTMMALHVGLRRTQQLAGIVGYSGVLLAQDSVAADLKSKPPVALIHGTEDPVVPASNSKDSAAALTAAGISCETLMIPGLQHGIDDAGAQFGAQFMQRVIG